MPTATCSYHVLGLVRSDWTDDAGTRRLTFRCHVMEPIKADSGLGFVSSDYPMTEGAFKSFPANSEFPVKATLTLELTNRTIRAAGREGSYSRDIVDVKVIGASIDVNAVVRK